ncbi:MAG: Nramp family divalent metal transporter [Melioribacteraceae bacterium]|nr:MAG: Nramp family divalent metal transporter [Melioribacteraceae bacterium]
MKNFLKIIAPGLLIAATGVGAGDLAGGAFAGSKLGMLVVWAVILGAFFKYVLTEGLARYQLATEKTFLEGLFLNFGRPAEIIFFIYLIIWSYAVGSAMISACGVAGHAVFPIFDSPEHGKIFWGVLHSLIGFLLVWIGTYTSFEKLMNVMVGLMFVTVVLTAIFIKPDLGDVVKGLVPNVPSYINPDGNEQGVVWTLALMGGVGGTLTILSYGYWIKEKGRKGKDFLKICRIDLAAAYIVTALFGIAMVVIASQIELDNQSSARLIIVLTEKLDSILGKTISSIFLIGAWAAVFSSLLGVWQSVPYMFTDFWNMVSKNDQVEVNTKSKPYQYYLIALAFLPMISLSFNFVIIQKIYAFLGSFVIPLIALGLVLLNSKKFISTAQLRNKISTQIVLVLIIIFFIATALQ